MGRKLGGGAVPFLGELGPYVTMWRGPRPTTVPSFTLIYPNVWPQYTNVTDRTGQTDRQRSDSIRRTVLQTVAQKLVCSLFAEVMIRRQVGYVLFLDTVYLRQLNFFYCRTWLLSTAEADILADR